MNNQHDPTTDETPAEPVEVDEQPTDDHAIDETEQSSDDGPNAEAARYRHRAKAAEAERDSAREQLDALRRQIVEDSSGLARPQGLWAAGVDATDLFSEDGRLDRTALSNAVTEAADRLGLARSPGPLHVAKEGYQPSNTSGRLTMLDIVQGRDE